ncbi:ribulose-phosphate 3-epimerase [Buttiauxella gaviniae]|uniref:ribulose-phosphate 3-epimerase n=1 Tax=Buttiauxella gaviniae TaxID=82990 RepID=UPI0039AF688A
MKRKVMLSPSVMCADLLDLKRSVKALEEIQVDALHIDVIDGAFSPAMPLGIDTIKRLRDITTLDFDVHIMSLNNEFFIGKMLEIGVQQISFHYESSLHHDRLINLIKRDGVKAGVALNPATPLSSLDYLLPQLDNVLLMLINPGFADNKNEQQVAYATQKVRQLADQVEALPHTVGIQVDGRVSFSTIPQLVQAGATNLVLGSTSLYVPGKTLQENKQTLDDLIYRHQSQGKAQ